MSPSRSGTEGMSGLLGRSGAVFAGVESVLILGAPHFNGEPEPLRQKMFQRLEGPLLDHEKFLSMAVKICDQQCQRYPVMRSPRP